MGRDPLTCRCPRSPRASPSALVCQFVGVKVSEPPAETVMLVSPVPASR